MGFCRSFIWFTSKGTKESIKLWIAATEIIHHVDLITSLSVKGHQTIWDIFSNFIEYASPLHSMQLALGNKYDLTSGSK